MTNLRCYFVYVLIILPRVQLQKTFLDTPANIQLLRFAKELFFNAGGAAGGLNSEIFKEAKRLLRAQTPIPQNIPFPCNTSETNIDNVDEEGRSKNVPTSVHRLRPGDIDIIAAMGDSLTAGIGLLGTNLLTIPIENRGMSFSGGGLGTWREILTLPNILKVYNPNLFGYTTENSFTHQRASQFNVAEGAAISSDLPYMADNLIRRMKSDPRVDLKNHWKLITIMIGGNDVCSEMCWHPPASNTLVNHKRHLVETIRLIKDNLPRTIVSIIALPDIRAFISIRNRPFICEITAIAECVCFMGFKYRNQRHEFLNIVNKWYALDEEISNYPEFQTEDFAVLYQPFTVDFKYPTKSNGDTDFRYMAPDCFHVTQILNAKAAVAYWNNLFEPPNAKSNGLNRRIINMECPPEERPYIATLGNS